jgi:error-prone DNA polymerase
MSLQDIDGISSNEIETISAGRPYIDIADFIYRSGASYPTTEALISIGAFDQLHGVDKGVLNRRDLLLKLKDMKGFVSKKKPNNAQISFNLLSSDISPSGLPNMSKSEIMEQEISNLGIDISAHVLSEYAQFLNHIGAVRSCDLITKRSDELVLVAGVKVALQTPPVRSGKRVMFLTLDDGYGCNDLTFFEDTQTDYAQILRRSSLILVEGHLRKTGPRGISIRATRAWELDKAHSSWHQSAHLRSKVAR